MALPEAFLAVEEFPEVLGAALPSSGGLCKPDDGPQRLEVQALLFVFIRLFERS